MKDRCPGRVAEIVLFAQFRRHARMMAGDSSGFQFWDLLWASCADMGELLDGAIDEEEYWSRKRQLQWQWEYRQHGRMIS